MKTYLLILFFALSSCGQNCKDLPSSYKNYEEAKTVVLRTNFKFTDDCDVSESSFITSADYYSCDGSTGYFVIGMNDKNYIFQNMPYEVWEGFKNAESKGIFYNREIRGRYQLRLK
jgi:hypothetical protein